MKEWIPLFQTMVWAGLISYWIGKFLPQVREFFGAITKRVDSGSSVSVGLLKLGEDLRDSDKISKEDKDKVATELTQKRKEDYVYEDWHNAAVIAYSEKRYEATLHDLSQALQYAKTKEQTARALFNQGVVFGDLDRPEKAIQVYEQINARYGADTEPGVREKVAEALVNQGVMLEELGRSEEVLQVLKQMNARYGKDTDPGVRKQVANALLNQGDVLGQMGRFEEAMVVLRKAEVIFSALGITEGEQQVRKLIEQWEKKK